MIVTEPDADLPLPEHSITYKEYFHSLQSAVTEIYKVAESARAVGYDPQKRVEIPPAHDVAARVEATLEGPKGVAIRIRELQETYSREEVAFIVAKEVALGELGGIEDSEKAADKAVRVALSILTESITAAPLEGISKVRIRGSGTDQYLALYLAGPIRAAGGTEAAVTVLVADHVRQVLQLPAYRASEDEVERALEEIELYARNANLQYTLKPEHIRFAASKLPIMLTGDPTERYEVSGSRDLDRIESNRVRGGSVLVLNDGVVGRAAKLAKIVNRVKIPGWEWLDELAAKVSKAKTTKSDDSETKKLAPKPDYLADVIGGRPVFSHPSRVGGFRLRYGRSRNTGLAGVGTHPATMFLVEEFLAPGTHIRTERPGKGSIVAPVDSIEGPIVLLRNGTVQQVNTSNEAREIQGQVERILYLGDILIALGEFLENNHPLVPSGYCEEWWSHDLDQFCSKLDTKSLQTKLSKMNLTTDQIDRFIQEPLKFIPTAQQALTIAEELGVPLHPHYLYRWLSLTPEQTLDLREWVIKNHTIESTKNGDVLVLPNDAKYKELLELLGAEHTLQKKRSEIHLSDEPIIVFSQLGDVDCSPTGADSLELVNSVSPIELRDKLGFAIGARMGRPEKALARKMRPPVQSLFPVGRTKSSERRIEKVAESTQAISTLDMFDGSGGETPVHGVNVEMVSRVCPNCETHTFESFCPECKIHTELQRYCSHEECGLPIDESTGFCPRSHDVNLIRDTRDYQLDLSTLLDRVKHEIEEPHTHGIRGVLGLTSGLKIPEYLGKGILRAKHDVYCYRDGTARFDATDAPLTHFIPREIGVSIQKLNQIGYKVDIEGNPLVSDDQIVELKVQDIIVPENCADYLIRVGKFVDDCLEKIYGMNRFYNFSTQTDIVGQLVIGLAPHTSAGIIGRIVGFTNASLCYAHPYWHAAKRRNCLVGHEEVVLLDDLGIVHTKPISSLEGENLSKFKLLSIDEKGRILPQPIQELVKLPAPELLYRIRTETGREMTVTPDHKMVRKTDTGIEFVETEQLSPDDILLSLKDMPSIEKLKHIDLIEYYAKTDAVSDMRIHGVKEILHLEIGRWNSFPVSTDSLSLDISSTVLWEYICKDSIPLDIFLDLLSRENLNVDYSQLTISYRESTNHIPVLLDLDRELGELAGLYLSTGFSCIDLSRDKTDYSYRTIWNTLESEIAKQIESHCKSIFGVSPSIEENADGKYRLTINGKVFMELFRDILGLGSDNCEQRADRCICFSTEFQKGLVSVLLENTTAISNSAIITSENRNLLNHLGLILIQFGIFPHYTTLTRPTDGCDKLQTFYSLQISSDDFEYLEDILFSDCSDQVAKNSASCVIEKKQYSEFGDFYEVAITEIEVINNHSEDFVYDFVIDGENKTFIGGFGSLATYDCDGDEDAVILVMDALLNFSKSYLPAGRGGFMDAPLVLSVILNPNEVDDEAHNIEVCSRYPAEFYNLVSEAKHPKAVQNLVDIIENRLNSPIQYEGFMYTHGTTSFDAGPRNTRYKVLGSMVEKLDAQLRLAKLIRAVDEQDVAARVLSNHFLRDIRGNLRAYSTQKIQCLKCHRVYRRIPLSGLCRCGASLSLTVRKKNISKYLEVAERMIEEHGLSDYLRQRIRLVNSALESLFFSEQTALTDYF
ncbi:MAG: DNA polymerase II large subunit [Candidatus Lokiarchaeota archaeon]|nr:DNA polymerase II large subunit [Candidatus Lokiarchaeota archaeon]